MKGHSDLAPGVHGVVIVHGIGTQQRGDVLADFSKALCDTLISSPINSPNGRRYPTIELKSDISGIHDSVALQITSPYNQTATWLCREAFWRDAFPRPKASQVLWWGLNLNLKQQVK